MNRVNYSKELDKITDALSDGERPSLLLHSCCAPCSSYCMEYLREYFDITVFYYNPNISSEPEYIKRLEEEIRLIDIYNAQVKAYRDAGVQPDPSTGMKVTDRTGLIKVIRGDYISEEYTDRIRGYEACPEGGDRCGICFELRIAKSFEKAYDIGSDYVTTTLTISPLKNAERINDIGYRLQREFMEKAVGDPGRDVREEVSGSDDGEEDFGSDDGEEGAKEPENDVRIVRWLPSEFKKKEGYKRSIELSHVFDLYRQNYCGCVYSRKEEI